MLLRQDIRRRLFEILKAKKNGNYNVIQIDPDYVPAPVEKKQVYGITFEQGRNELKIDRELLSNIVTEKKELPDSAKIDMMVALITLKYTQSNSVCYVKDGQAIGVGAGQQSRVHCTRLAGQKADNWYLRQAPQVLNLEFVDGIRRADRDNAIDVYIGEGSGRTQRRRMAEDIQGKTARIHQRRETRLVRPDERCHPWL